MSTKKILLTIALFIIAYLYEIFGAMPSVHLFIPNISKTETPLLIVPLDSRPPCTTIVAKLATLGEIDVTLPPKELLDNYNTTANKEKLFTWLTMSLPNYQKSIISSDILIHGSLLASRIPSGTTKDEELFFDLLKAQQSLNPNKEITIFSVIPRLLVSDDLVPDSWYQWHLMRYSTLKNMVELIGDPYFTNKLQDITNSIPKDILDKYNNLYANNDKFNHKLIDFASQSNFNVVIGQDDTKSFGLPNNNQNHALAYMQQNSLGNKGKITNGADEIASLLLTSYYTSINNYKPQVLIEYSSPKVASKLMPYMANSVEATIKDKISFIGGTITSSEQEADFILFVNCGDNNIKPSTESLLRLNKLVADKKKVALIDLTANYDPQELMLPFLLDSKFPVGQLIAFSGWNTLSNSVGSAISQATIFTGELKKNSQVNHPSIYAKNLEITTDHLLDDYAYQKLFHAQLKQLLKLNGFTPANFKYYKPLIEQYIQGFIGRKATEILYTNLGRAPFYIDEKNKRCFYVTAIKPRISLPWERIFEIELNSNCEFGYMDYTF